MKTAWTLTTSKTPPKLFYEASQERDIHLRMAAEKYKDTLPAQGELTNTNHLQRGPEKVSDFIPT